MNNTKSLYIIILSIIFTGNIVSMEQSQKEEIEQKSLPNELFLNIIDYAIIKQAKQTINNSYNDIFNKPEPKTIKVNLNKFKGFRYSSGCIYDLINGYLKSKSFEHIIDNLKQKRFDELFEALKYQSIEEYNGLSKEDLNKALINILNKALSLISKEDFKQVVKLILAGADVNTKNNNGYTALREVSIKGYKEIVEMLIQLGADVNATDKVIGETALMRASEKDDKEIVEMLIKAKADVNVQNEYGTTALMYASLSGNKEIVEMLLDKGADVNATDRWGKTALMEATIGGNKEIVKILLDKGADANTKNNNGITALMWASRYGQKDIVQILIKAGADVNVQDKYGNTALIWASEKDDKEIVEMLNNARSI